MACTTPGRSKNRAGSTGPAFRSTAMATRSPPGIGWARQPRASILRTTTPICAGVASLSITMSIFHLQQQARGIFLNRGLENTPRASGDSLSAIFPKSYLSGIPDKINRSGRLPGVTLREALKHFSPNHIYAMVALQNPTKGKEEGKNQAAPAKPAAAF